MREFKQNYTDLKKMMNDIGKAFKISEKMIEEIEFCILHENLNNIERSFLEECKGKILELLSKYNGYQDEEYANELSTVKKDFELIFTIEQAIYESITLQLWEKAVTPVEKRLERGEHFAYIVHCGDDIIYLPGYPEYKKIRNFDADYISASLITDQQMATYGAKKVGLIINPDSVIAANTSDAGTIIAKNDDDSIKRVHDFNNGKYIVTRMPTTKIQSPKYHEEECVKKLKARPLSNPGGAYDEVIAEDSKVKVLGVFFQTNGCEINLEDYYRALVMKEAYNVPIKPINMAVYRINAGLEPYESNDYRDFIASLNYWTDKNNLDKMKTNPENIRKILKGYYEDIVIGAFYDENIKKIIHDTFLDILKYVEDPQNMEEYDKQINEKNKLFEESIILIGPSGAGKSTVAEKLKDITGMPRLCLDRIANNDRQSGFMQNFNCSDEYNYDMIQRVLKFAEQNGEPGIVDFGAGHSVYDDSSIFNDVKEMLKKFKNIVLLIPSVDIEQSLAIMSKRSTGDFSTNRKFLTSPCNRELATLVEYENGRSPQEIAESIINRIKSKDNKEDKVRN